MSSQNWKYFSWYDAAVNEIGQKEIKGDDDNPRIIEYHKATTLRATQDEVPWCSSFVNWCLQQAGYTGTRSAAAASWLAWGTHIVEPVKGCIVVVSRVDPRKPNGKGHHVGFYAGKDDKGNMLVLGGNQSDAVNVKVIEWKRVSAYIMPAHLDDDDQGLYDLMTKEVA